MIIDVLNPDTETEEEKLYTITARYKPKRHIMEIIEFRESENMLGKRQKDEIVINGDAKVIGNPQ